MITNSDDFDSKSRNITFPLDREKLYELAWSMPMTALAKKCGVSSSYLARVFTQMNVPRPERGYWAKLAAGKKVIKPSLPKPGPEDLLLWNKGEGITLSHNPKIKPGRTRRVDVSRRPKGSWHPLLRGTKDLFLKGKETENGYLRPNKRVLPDLLVSTDRLESLLGLANRLYWTFEVNGHRVVFEPKHLGFQRPNSEKTLEPESSNSFTTYWYPYRSTLVFVGDVAIGLMLVEVSEQVECVYDSSTHEYVRAQKKRGNQYNYSWTTKRWLPTGNFKVVAYSPYPATKWEKEWLIPSVRGTKELFQRVVKEVAEAAPDILKLHVEAAELAEKHRREWEIERQEYRRAERERIRLKAADESKQALKDIIDKWGEAERIKRFFDQAEAALSEHEVEQHSELKSRLEAARSVIGQNEALNAMRSWKTPDELFTEMIKGSYWEFD